MLGRMPIGDQRPHGHRRLPETCVGRPPVVRVLLNILPNQGIVVDGAHDTPPAGVSHTACRSPQDRLSRGCTQRPRALVSPAGSSSLLFLPRRPVPWGATALAN